MATNLFDLFGIERDKSYVKVDVFDESIWAFIVNGIQRWIFNTFISYLSENFGWARGFS